MTQGIAYRISEDRPFYEKKVMVFHTEHPNAEATLAFSLLEKWGQVCAMPDGVDEAGRQKQRLLSAEETATRAFDIAAHAMRLARERGLMLALPDVNALNAEADALHAAEQEEKLAQRRQRMAERSAAGTATA